MYEIQSLLQLTGLGLIELIFILVWSLLWKGVALWIAARKGTKTWFIALLIINTMGILELAYIFYFSKTSHADAIDKKIDDKFSKIKNKVIDHSKNKTTSDSSSQEGTEA
jgi:hypothetical protein